MIIDISKSGYDAKQIGETILSLRRLSKEYNWGNAAQMILEDIAYEYIQLGLSDNECDALCTAKWIVTATEKLERSVL